MSGESGSGKTHTAMVTLRKLFETAGGGAETDTFKHLSAAFTVLRSLGSAKTAANRESSRIGHFIEVQGRERSHDDLYENDGSILVNVIFIEI